MYPIFMNGEAVMLPSYFLKAMLQAIVDFQVEELLLVPPIILRLAKNPLIDQYNLSCVKRWTSGAAPV